VRVTLEVVPAPESVMVWGELAALLVRVMVAV
jgi:hypothetical protein